MHPILGDPFRNHPELRGKIADPLSSNYRQLDLATLDAAMASNGVDGNWRYSDGYRARSRAALLKNMSPGPLWVFAYGSLMWDPAFVFDEVRMAHLTAYARRFCLRSVVGRGSPEQPGLMAGLDNGTGCEGLAFRIPEERVLEETEIIWRRELLLPAYTPTILVADTSAGPIEVLAFVIDHTADNYCPDLSLQQAAYYIATGKGAFGSSWEYLDKLAKQFEVLGIEDEYIMGLWNASRSCMG